MQMCIEIIRLLFSPLRAALSKSCKSPEVSIINVYLGAPPEIVLKAPQKHRLCAEGPDWGIDALLGYLFTSNQSLQIILLSALKVVLSKRKSIQNSGQKAKGGVAAWPSVSSMPQLAKDALSI